MKAAVIFRSSAICYTVFLSMMTFTMEHRIMFTRYSAYFSPLSGSWVIFLLLSLHLIFHNHSVLSLILSMKCCNSTKKKRPIVANVSNKTEAILKKAPEISDAADRAGVAVEVTRKAVEGAGNDGDVFTAALGTMWGVLFGENQIGVSGLYYVEKSMVSELVTLTLQFQFARELGINGAAMHIIMLYVVSLGLKALGLGITLVVKFSNEALRNEKVLYVCAASDVWFGVVFPLVAVIPIILEMMIFGTTSSYENTDRYAINAIRFYPVASGIFLSSWPAILAISLPLFSLRYTLKDVEHRTARLRRSSVAVSSTPEDLRKKTGTSQAQKFRAFYRKSRWQIRCVLASNLLLLSLLLLVHAAVIASRTGKDCGDIGPLHDSCLAWSYPLLGDGSSTYCNCAVFYRHCQEDKDGMFDPRDMNKTVDGLLVHSKNTLKWFEVNNCSFFESVPANFGNFENLYVFASSNAGFNVLPDEIGKLMQLRALHITSSNIKRVPTTIRNLHKLVKLSLHGNQIQNIPDDIGSMTVLSEALFQNNNISEVPQSIGLSRTLQILGLSNNNIKNLPMSLWNVNTMLGLYLSRNKLVEISERIGNLQNLIELDISSNELSALPGSIGSISSLYMLSAGYNNLSTISADLSSVDHVYLWPNNFCEKFPGSTNCNNPTITMTGGELCYSKGCNPSWLDNTVCDPPGIDCNIAECGFDTPDCRSSP